MEPCQRFYIYLYRLCQTILTKSQARIELYRFVELYTGQAFCSNGLAQSVYAKVWEISRSLSYIIFKSAVLKVLNQTKLMSTTTKDCLNNDLILHVKASNNVHLDKCVKSSFFCQVSKGRNEARASGCSLQTKVQPPKTNCCNSL